MALEGIDPKILESIVPSLPNRNKPVMNNQRYYTHASWSENKYFPVYLDRNVLPANTYYTPCGLVEMLLWYSCRISHPPVCKYY